MKQEIGAGFGIVALATVGLVGCAPVEVDEDADSNRNAFLDGVEEPNTPAPPPVEVTCAYPEGTGIAQGNIVPYVKGANPDGRNMSWEGYAPGGTMPEKVYISDFYDCDGSRGIHAVFFTTSQYG